MIELSRLNGRKFFVNADLIKMVESTPDTIVTLLSGEKLMVLESTEAVVNAANDHWKRVNQEPPGHRITSVKAAEQLGRT